jgi:adenosylcobinamide kinase/adenosylcobinamide-phosphate guanylyltransferase
VSEIAFFIGGCRSGKSRQALNAAEAMAKDQKIFIATCIPRDEEMRQRVDRHQKERNRSWSTVEAPLRLSEAIAAQNRDDCVLLVDCLTLWISNLLLKPETTEKIAAQINELVRVLKAADCPIVLVSNEVGSGVVPENKLSRDFRDLVGFSNQAVADCADRVLWMVAGVPVRIKG